MNQSMNVPSIQFHQDVDLNISIMKNAAQWLVDSGKEPSEYWRPENMNRDFLLKQAEPEEFYVVLVDGKPAASVILQDNERNQSWKYIDKDAPQKALYVHWLSVHRDFAGQDMPRKVIEFAITEAKKRNITRLRLDANANEAKLMSIYESLGFTLMGIEPDEELPTAYYQMALA